jgi:hypothetical protein
MTTASLSSQLLRETRLLGLLYPAAVILGIGSAFVSTHTNLKIVTSEPRSVASPPVAAEVSKPVPPLRLTPIANQPPTESNAWEFGFPTDSPVVDQQAVAEATIPANTTSVKTTSGTASPVIATSTGNVLISGSAWVSTSKMDKIPFWPSSARSEIKMTFQHEWSGPGKEPLLGSSIKQIGSATLHGWPHWSLSRGTLPRLVPPNYRLG